MDKSKNQTHHHQSPFTSNDNIIHTINNEYSKFQIDESIKKYSNAAQEKINEILSSLTRANKRDIQHFLSLAIIFEYELVEKKEIDKIKELFNHYQQLIKNKIELPNSKNFKELTSHDPVINIQFSDHYECPEEFISIIKNNRITRNICNFYIKLFGMDSFMMVVSACGCFMQKKGALRQYFHKDNSKKEELIAEQQQKYESKDYLPPKMEQKLNKVVKEININRTLTVLIALDNQYEKHQNGKW